MTNKLLVFLAELIQTGHHFRQSGRLVSGCAGHAVADNIGADDGSLISP